LSFLERSKTALGRVRNSLTTTRGRVFGYERYLKVLNEGTTTQPRR
jgi:hypothetical protein